MMTAMSTLHIATEIINTLTDTQLTILIIIRILHQYKDSYQSVYILKQDSTQIVITHYEVHRALGFCLTTTL